LIVDICVPTAAHTSVMDWAYQLGARRFIVEKPAAPSLEEWNAQVSLMRNAEIFVSHPYIFSTAFRIASEAISPYGELVTRFDKDRLTDDERGRGAAPGGSVPHILQVEVPHQISMLLAIDSSSQVTAIDYNAYGTRYKGFNVPVELTMGMSGTALRHATVQGSLRAARSRSLRFIGDDGAKVQVTFPTTADLESSVFATDSRGCMSELFRGRDDLLRGALTSAVRSLEAGFVPTEASHQFASLVLAEMDKAVTIGAAQDDTVCAEAAG
jgi:predicted dehydrogenase